ncbi:MAG: Glycosyl transferase group 1 [Candidatus Moranbacteria bacterium GW2011_GWE1_36_7]|nr:MAG: Glycosyl transferase group 1 [Candidatus Moranbacteria bacterium GW2011_GWE1_36_7]
MKIAIFTNNYLPNPFGVSMSIESFRKEFKKLGHSVYIFAPDFKGYVDEDKSACLGSSRVFRYPALDLKFKNVRFPIAFPYSYRVDRILEKLEIDVIHSQHPNLLGWQARRWAKKKNVPLVFTWHTLYDQYAHFAPFIPSKLAAWWTIKNAVGFANNADQIVTPTPSVTKMNYRSRRE